MGKGEGVTIREDIYGFRKSTTISSYDTRSLFLQPVETENQLRRLASKSLVSLSVA
jgi:hypothetical protein